MAVPPLERGETSTEQALPSQMMAALHAGAVGSARIAAGGTEPSCSGLGKRLVGESGETVVQDSEPSYWEQFVLT